MLNADKKFDKMTIAVRKDYLFRTEYNVGHSDATLVIAREMWDENKAYDSKETEEDLTGETKKTVDFCRKHGKPFLVIFTANLAKVIEWLRGLGKEDIILNVAGPRDLSRSSAE